MLGGLAFVFPIAVYCLILALLNRRGHPIMVPGTWDFAEVLFACSGFLVFGGPAILTGFHQRWRDYWLFGQKRALAGMHDWSFWIGVWAAYFVIVIAGSILLLWQRRLVTAIYNVEPASFVDCLAQVLDRLGLDWVRSENRVFIGRQPASVATTAGGSRPVFAGMVGSPPHPTEMPPRVVLELEPFAALRHLTLRWSPDAGALRTEVEAELEQALMQVPTSRNSVAFWFLSIAVFLFATVFLTMAFCVFLLWRAGRL